MEEIDDQDFLGSVDEHDEVGLVSRQEHVAGQTRVNHSLGGPELRTAASDGVAVINQVGGIAPGLRFTKMI